MPVQSLSFGQQLPGSGDKFLRVKQKGDQVQFKIAQEPVFTGKHFIQFTDPETQQTKWEVPECSRITSGEDCEHCEKFFAVKARQKKLLGGRKPNDLNNEERQEFNRMDLEARQYGATIEFYFPILDRSDGKFKILQTTNGVRNKFNAQFEAGVDVLDTEWILRNTGSASPAERYMLTPVDSSKVAKFSAEEEEEWAKACGYDLSQISQGGNNDSEE